jgi:enoyl-CoA hydratase
LAKEGIHAVSRHLPKIRAFAVSEEPEIIFEVRGHAGFVTLCRPNALNALTLGMIRRLNKQLVEWIQDDAIAHVVLRGAGGRAFCAGGDVRRLYEWGRAGDGRARQFYREEYVLNTIIKRCPKPYVALIDGVVMGGGLGISVHGSLRIGGPNTVVAMPETGIGLFPDVGGSWFLPRLPGHLGTYLALTGARLGQADALWAGILTHPLSSGRLPELAEVLATAHDLDAALAAASADPGVAVVQDMMPAIDRCFSAGNVEDILARLDSEAGQFADWARATADTLRAKSPTSLKIALRQMRLGATLDFEDCMRMEFRIVSRLIRGSDFYEGVRAVIIDKDDNPRWQPDSLAAVTDDGIDAYFAPLPGDELQLPQA